MPRSRDRKFGWLEFTLRLTDKRLRAMIVECAIELGWSMDSIARRALAWHIEQHVKSRGLTASKATAYALPGGQTPEILRRKPETLRKSRNPRLAVRYPPAWQKALDRLVADSVLHDRLAPLWRAAILGWLDSDECVAAKKAAKKAREAA